VSLQCDVRAARGRFALDVALDAAAGEIVAIVGPNGAGKSTLLRVLAGLAPCTGSVRLDGVDIGAVPPFRRPIGWVPQDGALFPHLTALDNVAFGLGGRGGREEAARWLTQLGLPEHMRHRPGQLSGGQAQRVALARALVRRPALLLLDEPMAALDISARTDARRTLRQHLTSYDGVTLLVTHDPVDAATLANRVVALDDGRVVQDATPADLARAPRTAWLAGWMGLNAFPGRAMARGVELAAGGRLVAAELPAAEMAEVLAVVPAHAVTLSRTRPSGSARNTWPVVVRELVATGSRMRIRCDGAPAVVAEVTVEAVADLGLAEGVQAWASAKATEVTVVPL
jgi:ABC-type Fe3+/spermidine/putrescine transport system ATPase subunit